MKKDPLRDRVKKGWNWRKGGNYERRLMKGCRMREWGTDGKWIRMERKEDKAEMRGIRSENRWMCVKQRKERWWIDRSATILKPTTCVIM